MPFLHRLKSAFTITFHLRLRASIVCVIALAPSLVTGGELPGEIPRVPRNDPKWIQAVVDDFRDRLALPHGVRVSIVPKNALMMSVEADDNQAGTFLLSLEEGFIETLSEDDMKAAIAHELGHVWIFTHHPFLQTEKLANEIAMRVVTRESLVSVYEKVWQRQGTKGDLVRFVGD